MLERATGPKGERFGRKKREYARRMKVRSSSCEDPPTSREPFYTMQDQVVPTQHRLAPSTYRPMGPSVGLRCGGVRRWHRFGASLCIIAQKHLIRLDDIRGFPWSAKERASDPVNAFRGASKPPLASCVRDPYANALTSENWLRSACVCAPGSEDIHAIKPVQM